GRRARTRRARMFPRIDSRPTPRRRDFAQLLESAAMSISYEEFRDAIQDGARRRSLLFRDGRPYFVLLSQQFSRSELEALCDTATAIRRLDRHRDGREFLLG